MGVLALLILLFALPLQARSRAVHFTPHERILWIAPHPDDESLIAPVLGTKCVSEQASCTLLVMTRGEAGECKIPGGCGDLGVVRSNEMAAAAGLFHAALVQWSLPDVFDPVLVWPANLVHEVAAIIQSVHPDVIYTFDPAHGSSCHPAHRYAAQVVLQAAGNMRVVLVETGIDRRAGIDFVSAAPEAIAYDARGSWHWLIADVKAHQSQFAAEEVDAIASVNPTHRMIWSLDAALAAGAHYTFSCP